MRLFSTISIIFYLIFDISLIIISLGLFNQLSTIDLNFIKKTFLFQYSYKFTTSTYEFIILLYIRQFLLIAAIILNYWYLNEFVRKLFSCIVGNTVFTYCFSLIKFLAFSEDPIYLQFIGVWTVVIWSIISSALLCAIWYWIFTKHSFNYQRLLNNRNDDITNDSDTIRSTEGDNQSETQTVESASTSTIRQPLHKYILKLFSYCSQQWKWFLAGFVFLNIYALARVFIPNFIAQVIADIVNKKELNSLVHSILILCGLTMISSFFGGLRGGCFDYATALVSNRVRFDLFSSLVNQDISFFDTIKTGETMSRLTSDCQTISSTVSTNVNVFLRNGVMLIGALVFMFAKSWRLALVTFIAVPFVAFVTKLYSSFYDKISERLQETIANANQMAEEILSTMRTVRSFACEKREIKRFENHLSTTLNVNKKRSIAYMGYTWNNEFCDNAILVAVLFYGGHLVLTDKMAKEDLITFLLYQMQLGENLYNLSYVISGLMEAVGASRKVFELMNRQPQFRLDGTKKPHVNGSILFDNVTFKYPSRPNNPVLKELNLQINAGETVALVGPSGGGKSSIVSLIEHFYEPDFGNITLDGVPIRDINHVYFHQKIALVAQEPILYEGSVRYNILYGCDFATEDDMLHASKMANVHDFVMELEQGYDTNCGEKGVQMSGGQKQRIAIARALVRNPAVLILDEATSALDSESESLVQQALNRCSQERTVLIIAHRLSTIEKADKIAVIYKGTVVQTGAHKELMADQDGIYYSLVSRQLLNSKVDG